MQEWDSEKQRVTLVLLLFQVLRPLPFQPRILQSDLLVRR